MRDETISIAPLSSGASLSLSVPRAYLARAALLVTTLETVLIHPHTLWRRFWTSMWNFYPQGGARKFHPSHSGLGRGYGELVFPMYSPLPRHPSKRRFHLRFCPIQCTSYRTVGTA